MTRETKIGLLVGLAFIIVIGILLSDHLTSTNEPQQAALAQAGGNVRSGVTTPGSGNSTPPITSVPANPQPVTPTQTVPTKEELTPKQPPVEIVSIGGAPQAPAGQQTTHPQNNSSNATQQQATQVAQGTKSEQPETMSAEQGVTGVDSNSPPIARATDSAAPGSLSNIAKTMGEELVPAGSAKAQQLAGAQQQLQLPPGAKQYKVEPGDSLSKIAAKMMGSSSKPNRDAIVALNPSLQKNPDVVVVGRTYIIPASSSVPATPTASNTGAPTAPPAPAPTASDKPASTVADKAPSATPEYFYTVKPGDTLTKIAAEQLGSRAAVVAIQDLNKDQLKGGDIIRPNMKLRLPAKPIASAQ